MSSPTLSLFGKKEGGGGGKSLVCYTCLLIAIAGRVGRATVVPTIVLRRPSSCGRTIRRSCSIWWWVRAIAWINWWCGRVGSWRRAWWWWGSFCHEILDQLLRSLNLGCSPSYLHGHLSGCTSALLNSYCCAAVSTDITDTSTSCPNHSISVGKGNVHVMSHLRTCMRGWLIPCSRSTTWWGLPAVCRNTVVRLLFHMGDIRRRIVTVLRPWMHELWISSKTRTTWRNVWRADPGLRRAPMLGRWHWLLPRHTMHFHMRFKQW
uniref:Uncharacterized protein n=1 Tax=Zea mays TaxID=4577 RepID=B8A286_MAIZE|nr:unknown [Zea mays]